VATSAVGAPGVADGVAVALARASGAAYPTQVPESGSSTEVTTETVYCCPFVSPVSVHDVELVEQ
jgi:hypothetical protein